MQKCQTAPVASQLQVAVHNLFIHWGGNRATFCRFTSMLPLQEDQQLCAFQFIEKPRPAGRITAFYCSAIKNDLFQWPAPRRCGTSGGSDQKMALRLFFIVPQQRTILLKSAAAKKYGLKKDHRNAVRGGATGSRPQGRGKGKRAMRRSFLFAEPRGRTKRAPRPGVS